MWLAFRLSPLVPDGSTGFTATYLHSLSDADEGTHLDVRLRIGNTTVPSAEFIAGIQTCWSECLDKLTATVAAKTPTKEPEQEG